MASSSHQSSLSRLDRVLTLLENGASPVTRKAAAKQLGDVQKKYPRELNNLLAKLLVYVCHNEWDTRLGAAEAIEAVVAQVPVYSPDAVTLDNVAVVDEKDADKLSFDMFNIDKVLNGSKTLLGSSGDEYKISINLEGLSAKDRVTKQRKILEKQLGLTVGDTSLGVASSELFQDADLVVHSAEKTIKVKQEPKQSCSNIISQFGDKMSSRERNLAKRKAKLLMKQQSREVVKQENNGSNGQPAKKRKKNQDSKSNSNQIIVDDVPKHCSEPQEWIEWPFNWISDELINLLFNPAWESRHGACLALREIIKKHGKGCGKLVGMTTNQLNKSNQAWLTDLSIRLLCVISLDRFADFVSDQAVAPVRESCAQTLSVVASFMEEKHVYEVIRILLYLHTKDEWEVRQSAMLVLQYIIAVRKDLQANILPLSFPTIVQGLHDSDGDVKSVSAKALVPVVQLLTRDSKYDEQLKLLLSILWDSLQEYDELTSSTQSILLLLSRLIKSMPLAKFCQSSRPDRLLSFLWPFFHHALASVREAALSTAISMLSGEDKVFTWLSSVSVQGLLNTFQCCLLEPKSYIRSLSEKVFNLLMSKSPASSLFPGVYHAPQWLSLACQPPLVPYDPGLLLGQNVETTIENESCHKERVIGGRITNTSCIEEFEEYIMRTRELTGRMIGMLCRNVFSSHVTDSNSDLQSLLHLLKQHLVGHMKSSSAIQRIVALIVLANWCEESNMLPSSVSPEIFDSVITLQNETLFYIEISIKFVQVQTDMKNLLAALSRKNIQSSFPVKSVYLFEDILEFCTDVFPHLVTSNHADLIEQKDLLLKLAEDANRTQCLLDSRVKSYAATVVITAARSSLCREESPWKLPTKLNPVIRPLMDCVKKEENPTVRTTVALSLSHLIRLCSTREPNPSNKLIKNLCTFLTSSSVACPSMESLSQEITDETLKSLSLSRELLSTRGLLTQLRQCEANLNETSKRKKKIADSSEIQQTSTTVSCMGACKCLQTICVTFGEDALRFVPQLFHIIDLLQGLSMHNNINDSGEFLQNIAQAVAALSAILPAVDNSVLQDKVLALLPSVMILLWNELTNLRFIASRCIALYAQHLTYKAMPAILDRILMSFDQANNDVAKKGAVEAVAIIINDMGTSIVSYAVLLFVPLLGCMSDQDPQIRLLSTHCFAQLLQYIAIESSIPDPPELPPHLLERKNKERQFLDQLFDPSSLEAYKIAVPINAKLRSYQEDGVKWLAFLNRYKLHGVLCDEMGLGKTLQTICIIASDHYYKAQRCKGDTGAKIKSLVICPPTLTGHWVDEVEKFCNDLKPLQYAGNPSKRAKLQPQVNNCNLVIASYEVVRNDIDFFNKFKWNYCVLDEGHAIRNGKSKTSQTVKTLSSNHRLILTGTPIQNSVLELWSLFDFLMPGFLGSEHEFNVSYTKPIVASRDAKSSSKEQENGVLALEALHRQVLPFMFRRMKEDVLKDLPPKIIQDYYCDLSALQLELYEDFARSRAKKDAELSINNVDNEKDQKLRSKEASHIFQALQYLQKVCNHPALVLTSSHPHYKQAMAKLQSTNSSLHDVKHATKLTALKQLLLDCGIGVTSDVVSEQSVVNQHRALIFCQHRNMLDIIQKDLLEALMPTVTFLRLDGMVPANQRFSLVTRFNSDPSIDLLLLTTKVGGLGLNLTGADTVIFFEHDWNPMVDLQAMDRAHRIGQKKVVNVYRLITRGTLEEKVLGLQKFKLNIANAVVGEDNRRLQSMGTSQVLELFTVNTASARKKAKEDANSSRGLRAMMEDLGDLWDHNQYNDAYNLDNFLQNLTTDK